MSTHGSLVVFGSGPGIGRNVAALFAERGFSQIVLLSRNTDRLKEDADFVKSKASSAEVINVKIDLSSSDSVRKALEEVDDRLGNAPVEAVLYNAARVGKSEILKFPAEDLKQDLQITVVSLYITAQWALPKLLDTSKNSSYHTPAFLVTSGGLYKNPFPNLFSLSAGKAGQYNLVHSMHKEFQPQGVHCALIVVEGFVKDDAKVTTARHIAEKAWELYDQPKEKGDLDVHIVDPDYAKAMGTRNSDGS
ncbi:hypothetical protein DOTSEDRAFT_74433 [Dothistroma septosporum NZE10]|uniref:NAD(P)-binding protein n=1 Tax=Dothistroma septosporum (strain NZE10 / CBS 128990) TaxID=675120 RepID=N1PFJ1_DOTSN|nr:hypothetical protein DOTSEDRAFT_74433 [Dothistroma septosporum NZE10]